MIDLYMGYLARVGNQEVEEVGIEQLAVLIICEMLVLERCNIRAI